jgi:hypothetical protein
MHGIGTHRLGSGCGGRRGTAANTATGARDLQTGGEAFEVAFLLGRKVA